MDTPLLSVVIVNWNTRDLLSDCLAMLSSDPSLGLSGVSVAAPCPTEVIVVDNASSDGSVERVRQQYPFVHLIVNVTNRGFGGANNQGITAARGRYITLLNSDTLPTAGALARLAEFMEAHPQAAVVGPQLLRPDGVPQAFAFGSDPALGHLVARGFNRLVLRRSLFDWATTEVQQVGWVSGACLTVRRAAVDQVGLFDEAIFMYFEDCDWCLRMRQAGWQVYYHPGASIIHLGGQSVARNPAARRAYRKSLLYFYSKHYSVLARMILHAALWFYSILSR